MLKKELLTIEIIKVGLLRTNCYLVVLDEYIYIIDPGAYCDLIINRVRRLNKKVKYILLTHNHVDHVNCTNQVAKAFNCSIYLHLIDKNNFDSQLKYFDLYYSDIDNHSVEKTVDFINDNNIEVIHTPGHTMGSVCFYFKNYNIIFSGDLIFYETIGRTDLGNSNLNMLIKSIQTKLFILPNDTKIYPGHGKITTIMHEKQFNKFAFGEIQ